AREETKAGSKRGWPATSAMSSAPVWPRAPTMPSRIDASAMGVALQLPLQVGLHRRPFAVQDRETDRVAQAAVAMAHVLAQDALLLGAQAGDGGSRCGVERAGVETDAGAAHRFERVAEQQQLGFGVQAGALHRARIPG